MVHKAHNTENCKQWHKWLSHCHRYHLENFLWAIQTKLFVDINWTGITAAASAMFTTVLLYNLSSGNWLLLHEPAVSHIHTFIASWSHGPPTHSYPPEARTLSPALAHQMPAIFPVYYMQHSFQRLSNWKPSQQTRHKDTQLRQKIHEHSTWFAV